MEREADDVVVDALQRGRDAAQARSWAEALTHLEGADASGDLSVDDLELLGLTYYMVGREPDLVRAFERAHRRCLDDGDETRAAYLGFWIGLNLALRGQWEPAAGWLARVGRMVETFTEPTVVMGYLQLPQVLQATGSGDYERAAQIASRAIEIGREFGERDLMALGVYAHGQAITAAGDMEQGLVLLDEAMVAVMADDLSPIVSGIIYCGVIEACHRVHALRRAHRWTDALTTWCDGQQGLVAFTGQCLTHRAELLQMTGDWESALAEAQSAGQRFPEGINQFPAARAFYRQGELHRLKGDLEAAAEAYGAVVRYGSTPQPGSSLLVLAHGNPAGAFTSITTALLETADPHERARLLPAAVTIAIAADDVSAARTHVDELLGIVERFETATLGAIAAQAQGEVLIAEGALEEAVAALSRSRNAWAELEAPHELATARLFIARACHLLGDDETTRREAAAAEVAFAALGAVPDAAAAGDLIGNGDTASTSGLTSRELEVLALVAGGHTNRQVADDLMLSERTVDRHVSNILTKLGVPSRTAATAYAYEHGLI